MDDVSIMVVAPNEDGLKFIIHLMDMKRKFVVLTNSRVEEQKFRNMGVENVIRIDTFKTNRWVIPQVDVGRIYIFESSLNLSCRYLQICRPWTSQAICIVTRYWNPRGIYRGLGADHVIYTKNGDVGFLTEK
ncbi:hypothetical protein [Paenibacillus sp. CMAA1364]